MTRDELDQLAKECGATVPRPSFQPYFWEFHTNDIERFYRAAFNAGIEAAADECDQRATCEGIAQVCAEAIRELEMKP